MERLGKYEIRTVLGRGAMGTVYEGWDPVISRRVAIKTVRLPDSADSEEKEQLGRFQQEAQAAGRLHHPNIVGVFDYAETDELAYIVMEFVEGRTLKALLEDGTRPDLATVGRLMGELLSGLEYSHAHQVIHRDIKPANIIVTAAGEVKIADFGIARIESSTMTQAGTIMGTPAYMSPEQFQGLAIDARTDIYSAGVVLFQLLTGKRPFEGSMATIMHAVLNGAAPRASDMSEMVPAALDAVVARAMARQAGDRFATAAAFGASVRAALDAPVLPRGLGDLMGDDATMVTALRPVPSGVRVQPKAPGPPAGAVPAPVSSTPARGRLGPVIAGLVLLVLVGGGGMWALSGRGTAPEPALTRVASAPAPTTTTTTTAAPAPAPQAAPEVPRQAPPPARTAAVAAVATVVPPPDVPRPLAPSVSAPPLPPAPESPPPRPAAPAPVAAIAPIPAPAPALAVPARPTLPEPQPPVPLPPLRVAEPPVVPPRLSALPALPAPAIPTPPPPPAPAIAPPPAAMVAVLAGPSPEAVHRAIAAAVRGAPCAVVTGDDRTALGASLRGVTGRGEPESRLRASVRDAAPQAVVDWQVAVADGPYCALLDVIRPYAAPFGGTARLLGVTLANGRTDLVAEDLVIPRVTMPDFAGYLQLDYVSSDGSLLHMHEARGGPPYAPDSTPVFGEPKPPAFKGWAVDEPFGTDLIVAVASSVPLFRVARPATDTLEAYLRDLRAALDQAARGGARISASVLLVRSSAKR